MKGQWFPQSLFCPLVCFVDVFLAFKRIPHHSMYDMEKHLKEDGLGNTRFRIVKRENFKQDHELIQVIV